MEPRQILIINNEKMQAPVSSNASPEIAILALVGLPVPINLDDVVRLTPRLTWNQVSTLLIRWPAKARFPYAVALMAVR